MEIHIYSVQRQEKDFPETNFFRPERWMNEDNEKQPRNNRKAANPFSLGFKDCIDKRYVSLCSRAISNAKSFCVQPGVRGDASRCSALSVELRHPFD